MGQLHNELRRSKLSEALTRAIGASKGAVGIERFGETLTPMIDLWSLPEWSALRNERLGIIRVATGPVAGNFSFVFLVNPIAAGRLVVVDAVSVATIVAGSCFLESATEAQVAAGIAAAAQTVGTTRDRRLGIDTATQTISGINVAQTIGGRQIEVATSTAGGGGGLFVLGLPHVLPPGQALGVSGRVANEQMIATFRWRERQALPGELL